MKERPILMSAPMVRAVLSGAKTQTRRPMSPQPVLQDGCYFLDDGTGWETQERERWRCPHGKVGDRLWVRETFCTPFTSVPPVPGQKLRYRATHQEDGMRYRWRPSIHMPRWASRITLEIASVRVERVQGITPEDAIAEGIEQLSHGWKDYGERDVQLGDPFSSFVSLWESIYPKRGLGWNANPFVWVIEFKVIS